VNNQGYVSQFVISRPSLTIFKMKSKSFVEKLRKMNKLIKADPTKFHCFFESLLMDFLIDRIQINA
jgi:hypothetical protein